MKRILLTYAGGRAAIGLARALKQSPEPVYLIGADASPYQLQRSITEERYLVPRAKEPGYLDVLSSIAQETGAQMVWPSHEAEIALLARAERFPGVRTFLPDHTVIDTCQDKMASCEAFARAGVPIPCSVMLHTSEDLRNAFDSLGGSLWVRAINGSGGTGALPVDQIEVARQWINIHNGWGHFMAAERLSPETITWESVWNDGELLMCQGRRRLYWEFSHLTMSGVTGIGGAHRWVDDPAIDEMSKRAVHAVSPTPHGVFSVDITYGWDGAPKVTEINCGRFMSGGVTHAVHLGCNAPYLGLRAAFGEIESPFHPFINPFPTDNIIIHGMDVEPVFVRSDEIDRLEEDLRHRRDRSQPVSSSSRSQVQERNG